jgi:FkbM family methyltransferase
MNTAVHGCLHIPQVGGLDGVSLSNTLWLHHALDWRGILIEGSPMAYPKLAHNRPSDITVHAAICGNRTVVHFADEQIAYGSAVSGIYEFMSPEFRARWHPASKLEDMQQVVCVPLTDILAQYKIRHIDLFSLDVEGGELSVLQALDFNCVQFNVLVVEADGSNGTKDSMVRELLKSKGYELHSHTGSDVNTGKGGNDWWVYTAEQAMCKQQILQSNRLVARNSS